ncbi:MAG: hypothetical protein D3903_15470, partial [Candidatus Electrothrix sp. GM3_4]|nr:hypothetical protein [Candidatus Electrothrix sp. GM3_4]
MWTAIDPLTIPGYLYATNSEQLHLLDWDAWPAQKNLSVLGFAYQHIEIQKEGVRVYDFEVKNAFK